MPQSWHERVHGHRSQERHRTAPRAGYAQELKRGMSGFSNFAVSFTIISILSGCFTLFGYGMTREVPRASAYGWLLVGFFVTFVGLAMAEVCSSYPTAAASTTGPRSWRRSGARLVLVHGVVQPARSGGDHGRYRLRPDRVRLRVHDESRFNVEVTRRSWSSPTRPVLAVHGLLNTFGVRLVALFNNVSVWWTSLACSSSSGSAPSSRIPRALSTIFNFSSTPRAGTR